MARKSIEERLAQIEAQRKTLKARLGKEERTKDTRRKVLLGALILHRLENANDREFTKRLGDWLQRELPGFLTRDEDKKLFPEFIAQVSDGSADGSNASILASSDLGTSSASGEEGREGNENGGGSGGDHGSYAS